MRTTNTEHGSRQVLAIAARVAKVVVFACLLVLVVKLFRDHKLMERAQRLSLATVLAFFALMFCHNIAVAYRWLSICRQQLQLSGVSLAFLLRLNLLAEFVVIWLPSSLVAEGLRLWRMKRATGDLQVSAASIVIDRIFGLLAMIVCILPFLPTMRASQDMALTPVGIGIMLTALAASAVVVIFMLRRYQGTITILRKASSVLQGIRFLSRAFVASCVGFALIVAAQGLVYAQLTTLAWLQIVPLILVPLLGRAIPISLFGVSAVEGGTFLLGGVLGVDSETLVLVTGLVVVSKYLTSTIGVIWEVAIGGWAGIRDAFRARSEARPDASPDLGSEEEL